MSKRSLAVRALNAPGIAAMTRACRFWRGVLVLNYHRIGSAAGSPFDWELWSATTDDFDAQVSFLQRDFDVIGPNDLNSVRENRTGRFILLTFDDGYRDNYEAAFPVLKSRGVPATFFITTGFLDDAKLAWWDEIAWMIRSSPRLALSANAWFDQPLDFDEPGRCMAIRRVLDRYKTLNAGQTADYVEFLAEATGSGRAPHSLAAETWMTWDMVREMHRSGMSIGGHTVTHPVLSRLDAERQRWEIQECKRRIETELGEPITAFSYPVGSRDAFNDDTRAALQDSGFRWAFSYYGGYSREARDAFNIPRAAIESDTRLADFRAVATLPQLFA